MSGGRGPVARWSDVAGAGMLRTGAPARCRRLALVVGLAIPVALLPIPAAAQQASLAEQAPAIASATTARDSAIAEQVRQVAAQLRCPVCQGLSLADSPSELAQEMRQLIRDQLEAGRTPDEVKAYFVSKYSEWILLEPEPHGANLAVYLLPALLLVGGGAGLFLAARRWTRTPTDDTPEPIEDEALL